MSSVSFLRHAAYFSPEDAREPLNIIGVGATGSNIGLYAARMGFHNFRIWDADIVEDHNLPNQIYHLDDINKCILESNSKIVLDRIETYIEGSPDDLIGPWSYKDSTKTRMTIVL